MRPLPHRDAIASLRATVDRATQAAIWRLQAQTAQLTLTQLMRDFAPGDYPDPLPGQDLVDDLARDEPMFAAFAEVHDGDAALAARILLHRLDQVLQITGELVEGRDEAAERMHALQHEQHEILEAGGWEAEVAELQQVALQRDALADALAPRQHRLEQLAPITRLLGVQYRVLTDVLSEAHRGPDPDGFLAHAAAADAATHLRELARMSLQFEVPFQLCFEPMVPDIPHPRHRGRLLREADAVHQWMQALAYRLDAELDQLAAELTEASIRVEALERTLLERLG